MVSVIGENVSIDLVWVGLAENGIYVHQKKVGSILRADHFGENLIIELDTSREAGRMLLGSIVRGRDIKNIDPPEFFYGARQPATVKGTKFVRRNLPPSTGASQDRRSMLVQEFDYSTSQRLGQTADSPAQPTRQRPRRAIDDSALNDEDVALFAKITIVVFIPLPEFGDVHAAARAID